MMRIRKIVTVRRSAMVLCVATLLGMIAGAAGQAAKGVPIPIFMPTPPEEILLGLGPEGISVDPAKGEDLQGAIDPAQATSIARRQFLFVGGGPVTPYLVKYTDSQYGEVSSDESEIVPYHVQKLVWMVVIDNAKIPIYGPIPRPEGSRYYTAPLVVVLDAANADFITAASAGL